MSAGSEGMIRKVHGFRGLGITDLWVSAVWHILKARRYGTLWLSVLRVRWVLRAWYNWPMGSGDEISLRVPRVHGSISLRQGVMN